VRAQNKIDLFKIYLYNGVEKPNTSLKTTLLAEAHDSQAKDVYIEPLSR